MKLEEASINSVMTVSRHTKLEETNSKLQQTETSNAAIYTFPLQYIINEHFVRELFDINDDHLYAKIWLSYCQNPSSKNTLRSIYSDHCYADIPELDCADVPESTVSDCIDPNNTQLSNQVPLQSSYPTDTSDITECYFMDCIDSNNTQLSNQVPLQSSYLTDITESYFMDCDNLTVTDTSDCDDVENLQFINIDTPPLSPKPSSISNSSFLKSELSSIDSLLESSLSTEKKN